MSTVTYKNQPAIHKTRGSVLLAGNKHIYRIPTGKVLWYDDISEVLQGLFVGKTLHVCCGASTLGDVRLDIDPAHNPDLLCDASNMRHLIGDGEFETVLADPPYNGEFQWNHNLLSELARVATKRIIFQHWFIPANMYGQYKKAHRFTLSDLYNWQPRTYFGRVQVISVFDNLGSIDGVDEE